MWRTVRLLTGERGKVPFSFFMPFLGPLCAPGSLPSSLFSVFSGEAATSNQRNAPADTSLSSSLFSAHRHRYVCIRETNTNTVAYQGKRLRIHIPKPKAKPDSTRESRSNADAMAISSRATK